MAVPPFALSDPSNSRTVAWSSVGGRILTGIPENATSPTWRFFGERSRKVSAASWAAERRSGATSVAAIEPEVSTARTTFASSLGTSTVAWGRARPTKSELSASKKSIRG